MNNKNSCTRGKKPHLVNKIAAKTITNMKDNMSIDINLCHQQSSIKCQKSSLSLSRAF
uniref:Uncharacterized protein n=1 Tax=Arion vulgaris TaxID=1028688 RepID=A0A0B7AG07_9EUPU